MDRPIITMLDEEREKRRRLWNALKEDIRYELDTPYEFDVRSALHILDMVLGKLKRHNELELVLDTVARAMDNMVPHDNTEEDTTS